MPLAFFTDQRKSERSLGYVVFVLLILLRVGSLCRDTGRPWGSQSIPEPPQIPSHLTTTEFI